MAENREQMLNRARTLYLSGSDPGGLDRLLRTRLRLSDAEISNYYIRWNLEQQRATRLAGAAYDTQQIAPPPREPRKFSNLFGILHRRGVAQSDIERIAQKVEIARFRGGRFAKAAGEKTGQIYDRSLDLAVDAPYELSGKAIQAAIASGRITKEQAVRLINAASATRKISVQKAQELTKAVAESPLVEPFLVAGKEVAKGFGELGVETAKTTDRFLQRTPGYARTGYQYASKPVGYAVEHTSGAVQKTPGLGGMLFGKVPRQPAERMKQLDPAIRSAINKGRIMLQKESTGVRDELDKLTKEVEEDLKVKKGQLTGIQDEINKIRNKYIKEETERTAPGAKEEPSMGG